MAADLPVEGESPPTIGSRARPAAVCGPDERVDRAAERARRCELPFCLVLNEANVVLGLLGPDVLDGDGSATAVDVMKEGPSTYRPSVGLEEARKEMDSQDIDHMIVTTQSGRLVGVVGREDLE